MKFEISKGFVSAVRFGVGIFDGAWGFCSGSGFGCGFVRRGCFCGLG